MVTDPTGTVLLQTMTNKQVSYMKTYCMTPVVEHELVPTAGIESS